MASKRTAGNDLNHTNWDREDEPEDAGSFKKASEDVIKNRVIKTAKRRNPIRQNENEEGKSNIFGGFTGFKKSPAPSNTAFNFLNNMSGDKEHPKTNGSSETDNFKVSPTTSTTVVSTKVDSSQEEYLAKLKGLNESVAKWIQKHVDSNPFINLNPVFKDYEKYFNDLEDKIQTLPISTKESNTTDKGTSKEPTTFVFNNPKVTEPQNSDKTKPLFSFGPSQALPAFGSNNAGSKTGDLSAFKFGSATPSTKSFSFGSNPSSATSKSNSTVSFGSSVSTSTSATSLTSISTSTTSGFSFGGTTPFTFKSTAPPPAASEKRTEGENEDEDEPPKVEFKAVEEEGHVFKIRCKVFVKKDGAFADRGVGNLFLKPVESSDKTQLIVRADTNLGNLLCNFIVSESIPMQRMGKKDVMLVCLPTPDTKPPPTPILLRVKSPEEADELLKTLEKYKK